MKLITCARRIRSTLLILIASLSFLTWSIVQAQTSSTSSLGFDRNTYPGDINLGALHQTFSYAGYWLNNPPAQVFVLSPGGLLSQ